MWCGNADVASWWPTFREFCLKPTKRKKKEAAVTAALVANTVNEHDDDMLDDMLDV